jgi:hypothetical protein
MVRATPGGRALSVLAAAVLVVALVALVVNVFRGGDDTATSTTTSSTTTTAAPSVIEMAPTEVRGPQLGEAYAVSNLTDGSLETEWQANHTEDLTVEFRWAQPVRIQYIEIFNIQDQDRFLRNYRIEGYNITVDDLPGVTYGSTLKDQAADAQRIEIASIETTTLTLEIVSSYPSQAVSGQPAFEELVVAEIRFFGTPAS